MDKWMGPYRAYILKSSWDNVYMFLVKLLFEAAAVMLDPSLFRRAPIFELLAHGKIGFKIESSSSSRNIIVVIIIEKIK